MAVLQWRVIASCLVLCTMVGAASGQGGSWSGTYMTPHGCKVTWSFSYGTYPSGGRILCQTISEVIEGAEVELETMEGEDYEHPNREVWPYRALDLARDLMRGRISASEPSGVFHSCDNPDCEIQEEAITEYTRKSVLEGAIGAYGIHLEARPEDWIVVREMAVALLEAKRYEEALNLMHEAYLSNPELGIMPISGVLLGKLPKSIRKLVVASVKQAHRKPSAKAWLLVSVLMQSQGKVEKARKMLIRAHELGLEEEIYLGLDAALP